MKTSDSRCLKLISQAVILAGGRGTRLVPFTDTNPKPMYEVGGLPFLEHLIIQVKSFGIDDIVILVGYLSEKIIRYFGDGSKWRIKITYSYSPVECETGVRIRNAYLEGKIEDEFLLMYCDNYCPVNYRKLVREYRQNKALLQLTVYRNSDGYTKNNIQLNSDGMVEKYDKYRKEKDLTMVDIGYAIINSVVIQWLTEDNVNFESVIYPLIVSKRKAFATISESRYYSVGDWKRLDLTKQFFSGEKYIFLDRDGTINVRPPKACYIEKPEDFVWLPGAKEAISELKQNGYKIILISNQPGIARGNLTENALTEIHEKMQEDLRETGAEIDAIYYCPHNWDEECECRKPKAGLFFKAQRDFSIDLTKCWMLGDDERDMHAGGDAGCKCMLISEQHPILEAVRFIIQMEG